MMAGLDVATAPRFFGDGESISPQHPVEDIPRRSDQVFVVLFDRDDDLLRLRIEVDGERVLFAVYRADLEGHAFPRMVIGPRPDAMGAQDAADKRAHGLAQVVGAGTALGSQSGADGGFGFGGGLQPKFTAGSHDYAGRRERAEIGRGHA